MFKVILKNYFNVKAKKIVSCILLIKIKEDYKWQKEGEKVKKQKI